MRITTNDYFHAAISFCLIAAVTVAVAFLVAAFRDQRGPDAYPRAIPSEIGLWGGK